MTEVYRGRKQCGNARRLAKRAHAPDARSVPTQIPVPTYEARGTACVAKITKQERIMLDAWDNAGTTGDILVWRGYSKLHTLARQSGTHMCDGPVAHDIRAIEGNTVDPIANAGARGWVRQLHIERKYG